MNDIDLSVIIVNYNVKEFVSNLIESIKKAAHSLKIEIIISDNASQDGSPQYIRQNFPEVILIENKSNLGFGKANNLALSIAKGKYFLIINPDTLVQEDTLIKMISFFEDNPMAGLAGCKILNPDGSLQLACRRSFPGPWTSFTKVSGLSSFFPKSKIFARYNLTYLDENKTYEVDAVSGSFMMMRSEVYEKIGGFDEQFFMYGEDLDLCYRVQKAGYKVFYVHDTTIIHYKGESTKRSSIDETKYFYNAQHLFVKKHLSSSLLVEIILLAAIYINKIFSYVAKRKLILSSILLDFIFFDFSLYVSTIVYPVFAVFHGIPHVGMHIVYTVPALLHIACTSILRVYRKDSLSVLKNLSAIFLSFFFVSTLTYFFKEYAYSRGILLLTYAFLFFVLSFWRIVYKIVFGVGSKTGKLASKRTMVAGFNEASVKIADKLKNNSEDIRNIVGLLGEENVQIGRKAGSYEIIASFENINKAVIEYQITEVIFPTE
ncbi:MAG: glycosyltransferase, partial [Bacteroidota bacterium]|nr:glycosyltransferase [Bacteroidota bacterium]